MSGEQGALHGLATLLPELFQVAGHGDCTRAAFLFQPRQASLRGLCLCILARDVVRWFGRLGDHGCGAGQLRVQGRQDFSFCSDGSVSNAGTGVVSSLRFLPSKVPRIAACSSRW